MPPLRRICCLTGGIACLTAVAPPAVAAPAYGPELQGFAYPWPVHRFTFQSQRQTLAMAYLDIKPEQPNGLTAVLLHGKNFCSATWEETIRFLSGHGYRVIAPDQIGFCKSSKPAAYQFTFQQLADNTRALLQRLGITKFMLIGHSTGGMLAIRYALMHPKDLTRLVLVDPVGLEDWLAKGEPYQTVDQWYAQERAKTYNKIRTYEQKVYYVGKWAPAYDIWAQMLAGMYRGAGRDAVAWDSALLYDMIVTQPVIYELHQLSVPTVLMIGDKDVTAVGANAASPEVKARLGHYPALAQAAARVIPNVRLVEFPHLGHAPQMQDPAAFHAALLKELPGR